MTARRITTLEQASALCGTLVWVLLACLAGSGHAQLGVIELLFLFAPLVIVPLGLALGRRVSPVHPSAEALLRWLQPLAAGFTVVSFWFGPGRFAAILAVPWLLFCGIMAVTGALSLLSAEDRTPASWATNIGRMDLAIAGGWLMISRMGLRPLGIQEPIVLLTAVHFHYTGFATALLAGTLCAYAGRKRLLGILVFLVIVVPFLVAAGFVWSATLKMAAALLLCVCLVVLAGSQLWIAGDLSSRVARTYLRMSSLAVVLGMVLASVYAIGDWLKQDWLVVPRMASTHGVLNGLGFALLGMLGWLVQMSENR